MRAHLCEVFSLASETTADNHCGMIKLATIEDFWKSCALERFSAKAEPVRLDLGGFPRMQLPA